MVLEWHMMVMMLWNEMYSLCITLISFGVNDALYACLGRFYYEPCKSS